MKWVHEIGAGRAHILDEEKNKTLCGMSPANVRLISMMPGILDYLERCSLCEEEYKRGTDGENTKRLWPKASSLATGTG